MERNQLSFTPGDTRRIQASFGHWCISPVCYKIGIFTDRFATLTKKHNSAGGAELLLNPVHKFSTILILNRPFTSHRHWNWKGLFCCTFPSWKSVMTAYLQLHMPSAHQLSFPGLLKSHISEYIPQNLTLQLLLSLKEKKKKDLQIIVIQQIKSMIKAYEWDSSSSIAWLWAWKRRDPTRSLQVTTA